MKLQTEYLEIRELEKIRHYKTIYNTEENIILTLSLISSNKNPFIDDKCRIFYCLINSLYVLKTYFLPSCYSVFIF
jgi:hypothetical protein